MKMANLGFPMIPDKYSTLLDLPLDPSKEPRVSVHQDAVGNSLPSTPNPIIDPFKGTPIDLFKGTPVDPFKGTPIDPFKGTSIDPFKGTLNPKRPKQAAVGSSRSPCRTSWRSTAGWQTAPWLWQGSFGGYPSRAPLRDPYRDP